MIVSWNTINDLHLTEPFFGHHGYDFQVLMDPFGEIRSAFDVTVNPTTILVSKDKAIVGEVENFSRDNATGLQEMIHLHLVGSNLPDESEIILSDKELDSSRDTAFFPMNPAPMDLTDWQSIINKFSEDEKEALYSLRLQNARTSNYMQMRINNYGYCSWHVNRLIDIASYTPANPEIAEALLDLIRNSYIEFETQATSAKEIADSHGLHIIRDDRNDVASKMDNASSYLEWLIHYYSM